MITVMGMKVAEIDFSFFIGQQVHGVNSDPDLQFILYLTKFCIRIECPWRIRRQGEGVLCGYMDYTDDEDGHAKRNERVQGLIKDKRITAMRIYDPVGDVQIKLDEEMCLDIFHCSIQWEGWELIGDGEDNDVHFWTLGTGRLDYPSDNPLVLTV